MFFGELPVERTSSSSRLDRPPREEKERGKFSKFRRMASQNARLHNAKLYEVSGERRCVMWRRGGVAITTQDRRRQALPSLLSRAEPLRHANCRRPT